MARRLSAPRARLRPARPPRGSRTLGAARHFLETRAALSKRWLALLLLVLLVTGAHLGMVDSLGSRVGALFDTAARPTRMTAVYVTQMAYKPPEATTTPKQRKPAARAARPLPAPAAPEPAVEPPQQKSPEPEQQPDLPRPPAMQGDDEGESRPPQPQPEFDWPVSTRLRYRLSGHVRGEVTGKAQVEWIREGRRYQVHLDVEIGLSLAPLATRRMSSDGVLTPQGLQPRHYDQSTRLGFALPNRAEVRFADEQVLLANGQSLPSVPGVQDTVSQFVQLSWMFERQPDRLKIGETIEMPLALPRKLSVWVYEVVGQEMLQTPFGEVPAYHLKPRAMAGAGGDLITEIWIAPWLRHLPVRFRIHQDAENHIDLLLDERPELAAKM